jgi:hypothetical protein
MKRECRRCEKEYETTREVLATRDYCPQCLADELEILHKRDNVEYNFYRNDVTGIVHVAIENELWEFGIRPFLCNLKWITNKTKGFTLLKKIDTYELCGSCMWSFMYGKTRPKMLKTVASKLR